MAHIIPPTHKPGSLQSLQLIDASRTPGAVSKVPYALYGHSDGPED